MTEREAIERLEEHGTILMSHNDGIECEEELETIGVDLDVIRGALRMIDYYTCSIHYDGEYHLAGELEEEHEKIREYLDGFYLDYELSE
jgi:hypothetical protein